MTQGLITPRMRAFMEDVDKISPQNFCEHLKRAVDWKPEIAEVVERAVAAFNPAHLEDHLKLKDEFEIVRSIDGFIAEPLKPQITEGIPEEIAFLRHAKNAADALHNNKLIALAKLLSDLKNGFSRVGPDYFFSGGQKHSDQEFRILYETTRGIMDKGECEDWISKQRRGAYPFPVSGVLRHKGGHPKQYLTSYKPVFVYFGFENLMDRSTFTFMDAMMPPLLSAQLLETEKEPALHFARLPHGYRLIHEASGWKLCTPSDPENLKKILPLQHLALPEALVASWGLDKLSGTLVSENDYIEAQILGGIRMQEDLIKIETDPEILKWIDQLLKHSTWAEKNLDLAILLSALVSQKKIKEFDFNP